MSIVSDRSNLLLTLQVIYNEDHEKYGSQYKFKMERVFTSHDLWSVVLDKFKIRMGRLYLISPELEIPNDLDGPWWNILQDVLDDMKTVRKSNLDIERAIVKDLATKECENINKKPMQVTEIQLDQNTYISSPDPINEIKYETIWTKFKTWLKGF